MIFLSVGTQEPFDRLARAIDRWAAGQEQPLFGQLGALQPDSYRPTHFPWVEFLSAAEYQQHLRACSIFVAHVGMGSILSALSEGKPLVMLPRRAALGEHRNEHQLATAERFQGRAGLYIAAREDDLGPMLDRLLHEQRQRPGERLAPYATPALLDAVRSFLGDGDERREEQGGRRRLRNDP